MTGRHIHESQFHEYLDDALDQVTRKEFETHIADCQECRQELEKMRRLFAAIESIPVLDMQVDLSSNILGAIRGPVRLSRQWKLAIAAQLAIAFLLLAIAWPSLSPTIAVYEIPTINIDFYPLISILSAQLSMYITDLSDFINRIVLDISAISSQFLLGDASVFIWPLAISATLLWLVGNGVLLRTTHSNNN